MWLVTLRFPAHGVPPPEVEPIAGPSTLAGLLAGVAAGRARIEGWPFRAFTPRDEPMDECAWVREHTAASVAVRAEEHLAQCVHEEPGGTVVARYLFDAVYASAHPAALDREHLELLHGTLAAKILDDGDVILDRDGLAASLRWVTLAARGARLSRDGGRR